MEPIDIEATNISQNPSDEVRQFLASSRLAPWKEICNWLISAVEKAILTVASVKVIVAVLAPLRQVLRFLGRCEAGTLLGFTTVILRMIQKLQEIKRRGGDARMFKMWYLESFSMGMGALVGGISGYQAVSGTAKLLEIVGSVASRALMGVAIGYLIYKGIESLQARKEKNLSKYVKNFLMDFSNALVLDFGLVNFDEGNDFSLFLVQMGGTEENIPDHIAAMNSHEE